MAKILVIEDYPSLQQMYGMALAAAGHQVSLASDGKEAQRIALQMKPDLILLDILLPEADGIQFLKEYQPAKHPETKVIVISNLDSGDHTKQVNELGVTDYLIKSSYTPKQLVEVVEKKLKSK